MNRRTLRGITLLLGFLLSLPLFGGEAKLGWTKLELVPASSDEVLLRKFGAALVGDYGTFTIVAVPDAAVDGLTRAAAARGMTVRRRDDFDQLQLPNAKVDVRSGLEGAPADGLKRAYPDGKAGLFLLQLAGPPRREWLDELHAMGWSLARYVPNNGYIAIGTPALQQQTHNLAYVQWLDFYHPYQKNAFLQRDGKSRELMFDLPSGPALEETIAAIEAAADGEVRVDRGSVDTYVYASMPHARAEAILHQQLVIGVATVSEGKLSDERQAMSLTSNLNAARTAPVNPNTARYWDWVLTRCPNCSNMDAASWKVGIADSGLDYGVTGPTHPNLKNRQFFGTEFQANSSGQCTTSGCDWAAHGTMVAGIVAGGVDNLNNAADWNFRDRIVPGGGDAPGNMGWYLGIGVAPKAGLFSTKAFNSSFPNNITPTNVRAWVRDAAIAGVTIQNHSYEHSPSPGLYTSLSREFDLAVRDANGADANRPEIFLTMAAGNVAGPNYQVSPIGMAKNILTVSGTENARSDLSAHCGPSESFRNLAEFSRTGTRIFGYVKPDVVAPGAAVVSTHSRARPHVYTIGGMAYCQRFVRTYYDGTTPDGTEYGVHSGTSFSAPVAAGAAIVVKRYLGSTPGATSPALTKAMLIAGAESIRGGVDRTTNPDFPGTDISPVPSQQQGFGRLSFEDILTGATPPLRWDQNASTRLFNSTGQTMTGRVRITDASKPVKVVLVWSDAAGTPSDTEPVNPLVNDLDLQVRPVGTSTLYMGNRMTATELSTAYSDSLVGFPDNVNTVEYARFTGLAQQEFDVTIKATRIAQDVLHGDATAEQDFALVVINGTLVNDLQFVTTPTPSTPTNVTATANGATVTITWSAAQNAADYEVERKTSSGAWQLINTSPVTGTSTTDTPSAPLGVVLYRVTAKNGSQKSAPSSADIAYVGSFTDGTIQTVPALTPIKAVHITEIRRAVNALREINTTLGPAYDANEINPDWVRGQIVDDAHWTSLMANLSAARLAATVPTGWSFRSPAPAQGVAISRTHLEDLRRGLE